MEKDGTLTIHNYRDRQNRFVAGGYMLAENGEKYDAEFQAAENSEAETDVPVSPEEAETGDAR